MKEESVRIIKVKKQSIFNPDLSDFDHIEDGEKFIVDLNWCKNITSPLLAYIAAKRDKIVVYNVSIDLHSYLEKNGVLKMLHITNSLDEAERMLDTI